MRNGFTHFSFGDVQEGCRKTSMTVQKINKLFSTKHIWAIALLMCLSNLSFAQTRGDGGTSKMTQPGAPAGSYSLSGFENVNLFNGNLNFNLPLVKIGGRGKAQSAVNLAIDSKRWEIAREITSPLMMSDGQILSIDSARTWILCSGINFDPETLDCNSPEGISNEFIFDGRYFTETPGYITYDATDEVCSPQPGYGAGIVSGRGSQYGGRMITRNEISYILPSGTLTRLFFTAPDGTEYELRDTLTDGKPILRPGRRSTQPALPALRGTVFRTADGSGLRFVSDTEIEDVFYQASGGCPRTFSPSGFLYFPDGTKYRVDSGNVSWIRDVNGNQINYSYNAGLKVAGISDSLGRQVQITYDNPTADPEITFDAISTQKSATEWQTVKVHRTRLGNILRGDFSLMNKAQMFPEIPLPYGGNYDPEKIVSKVELPDGRSYRLFYTPYNEIARIEMPTGAAIEYDFPMPSEFAVPDYGGVVFRPIKQRRIYANGGSKVTNSPYSSKQIYRRETVFGGYLNNESKITVEEHSGDLNGETSQIFNKSVHYFFGAANIVNRLLYPHWKEGREYKTEISDAGGQLRQKTETEWENPQTVPWGDLLVGKKVRVKSVTSTGFENSKSLTNKTTYGYDNDSLTNNKTDERISDYGTNGLPGRNLRHSKTYYLKVNPENGQDYTSDAVNLHGLPEKSELYEVNPDNSEVLISQSEIKYDEPAYTLLSGGGVPIGWTNPGITTPRGNATTGIAYNLSHTGTLVTHAQFDEFGNARKSWDAKGIVSEVQYSADYGYAFPTRTISAAPDPSNQFGSGQAFEATTVYNFYTGSPLTVTNENDLTTTADNLTTTTEYNDVLLRPTRVIAPNGQQTVFEYGDAVGNLYAKVKTQIDEQNWAESTSFADGLGRTFKTQTKDSAGDVLTESEFDNMGRVKRVTNPYRTGETKLWSETRYDALGRLVETFAPKASGRGDSTGITSYDLATDAGNPFGAVVIGTDASGRRSRSITNAFGQLIRVDEPAATGGTIDGDLGTLSAPAQPTFYKYDALGRMIEVTQGNQKRFFLYDTLGRLLRVRQPEQEVNAALALAGHPTNGQWTAGFSYDASSNVLTATDAKGVTITNAYDNLNRVKTRTYAGEAAGQQTPPVYFTYDGIYYRADNYRLQATGSAKGTLTQVRNGISTSQTTVFDTLGRPKEYQQITDGQTYQSSYQYNFAGALVEETYPSGRVVKNQFNIDGDLSKVESRKAGTTLYRPYASDFAFTAAGGISRMKLGNGRWETAKFNDRLQVTELGLGASATDASLWKVNYDYGEIEADGNLNTIKNTGNIARQTISFAGLTNSFVQTYKYDSLYRLKEAKETTGSGTNWTQAFTYDRFGNRLTFSQNIGGIVNNQTPTIDPATNRFDLNQGFGYDKNGNITSDVEANLIRQFTFNGENKQTEVKKDGVTIGRYFYDGEGNRIKKITDTETTIFVYSSGKLIAEYSTKLSEQPSTNYTTSDHLGSPRIITNERGEVKARRDFMPFGEELLSGIGGRTGDTGQKYAASKDDIRQKFTGYERDIESSLDFAQARMYSYNHGRFTSTDPLLSSAKVENPQTWNRYNYVLNNPLNLTDPSGLEPFWGYRDIEGGRQFVHFRNQEELDTYNAIYPGFQQWTGGNTYLFDGRRGLALGEGGRSHWYSLAHLSDDEWNGLVSAQSAESFSGDQRNLLNGAIADSLMRSEEGQQAIDNTMNLVTLGVAGTERRATREIALGVERLGSRMVLGELAEQTGASTFRTWAADGLTRRSVSSNFGRAFNQAANRADGIHFALDGMIDNVPGAVRLGQRGFFQGNFTNAELSTIYRNPNLFNKTQFYFQNRPVSPLFRP